MEKMWDKINCRECRHENQMGAEAEAMYERGPNCPCHKCDDYWFPRCKGYFSEEYKKHEEKKKEEFKGNRGFLGWRSSADFFTGNRFDFDNQSGIKENINTTRYEGLDTETSYEQEGTTTYVISQTGSSDGDETSSGTNAEVTQMSEGLILSGSGSESNNSYDVLAKR